MRTETTASRETKMLPHRDELTPAALRDQRRTERGRGRDEAAAAAPRGNTRLTASTGVILLALLAIEGVTLVALRPLLSVHVFVGMLLIPPIGLKLASTGYRFARYYTGSRAYVLAGPPRAADANARAVRHRRHTGALRLRRRDARARPGPRLGRRTAQGQLRRLARGHRRARPRPRAARARPRRGGLAGRPRRRKGSRLRQGAVAAALVAGLVLAIATVQYAAPWHDVIG